jgi:hypothetical protein
MNARGRLPWWARLILMLYAARVLAGVCWLIWGVR